MLPCCHKSVGICEGDMHKEIVEQVPTVFCQNNWSKFPIWSTSFIPLYQILQSPLRCSGIKETHIVFWFLTFQDFETTQPEMNAVVDYLDPLNEGFIDYKKFMNALYPDSERSKQPVSEAEKIANEVCGQTIISAFSLK